MEMCWEKRIKVQNNTSYFWFCDFFNCINFVITDDIIKAHEMRGMPEFLHFDWFEHKTWMIVIGPKRTTKLSLDSVRLKF